MEKGYHSTRVTKEKTPIYHTKERGAIRGKETATQEKAEVEVPASAR